jgi:double-strand break repair protein MRE11
VSYGELSSITTVLMDIYVVVACNVLGNIVLYLFHSSFTSIYLFVSTQYFRGHEHECQIDLQESVVGTFRITQPGSSVATSLTQGEAAMKQIGVLDIKGTRFRMRPIPLTQVRTFVMGDVSLSSQQALDPDDPKVDLRVAEVLENKVRVLRHDAEQQRTDRIQKAWRRGNVLADPVYVDNPDQWPLQESLNKPEEMLVRIRVEHNGFQALNNQRFGAKFVGTVANPVSTSYYFLFVNVLSLSTPFN